MFILQLQNLSESFEDLKKSVVDLKSHLLLEFFFTILNPTILKVIGFDVILLRKLENSEPWFLKKC
jgi:hypothetical protein